MSALNYTRLVIPLIVIFTVKTYFDTSNPSTIFLFRLFWLIGQFSVFYSLFRLRTKISNDKSNEKQKVKVSQKNIDSIDFTFNDIINLYKNNNNQQKKTKEIIKTYTYKEYDLIIFDKNIKKTFLMFLITPILHFGFGLSISLILSPIMNWIGLYNDFLFRIYILGHKSHKCKELERPFKFPDKMQFLKKYTDNNNKNIGNIPPKNVKKNN